MFIFVIESTFLLRHLHILENMI